MTGLKENGDGLEDRLAAQLDRQGYAQLPGLLSSSLCHKLINGYDAPHYRSTVTMGRHGFGQGEYRYFDYPLPEEVADLRTGLYPLLASIANQWAQDLGTGRTFPGDHAKYLARCHKAGQTRPTPLILKYGAGDYNCLHQDLYGDHIFPLQVAVLLSKPGHDFAGGEFVLTEQRPRMQSRATVVPLGQGDGVVFPVHHRLRQGKRGTYRTTMRHGVSTIRSGSRFTLGIIFHDAA